MGAGEGCLSTTPPAEGEETYLQVLPPDLPLHLNEQQSDAVEQPAPSGEQLQAGEDAQSVSLQSATPSQSLS
ncbi:MAG: hypothetical protein ACI9OJ_003641 [Myxococcota bacterium]|jgi:hypothetical protein